MTTHSPHSFKHEHAHHKQACHGQACHEHSLRQELICHLPYAAFSVALSFILLGILNFFAAGSVASSCGHSCAAEGAIVSVGYHHLFHVLHYIHLLFACVGTIVTFRRFSSNVIRCLLVGMLSPAFFCSLSDVALPALAGQILGLNVPLHICFFSLPDLMNLLPFMAVGIITGFAMSRHHNDELSVISLRSHFAHILISSLASTCYVMSYGFEGWHAVMGMLFLFLVAAVVIPCTISDVIVPMYFARWRMSS